MCVLRMECYSIRDVALLAPISAELNKYGYKKLLEIWNKSYDKWRDQIDIINNKSSDSTKMEEEEVGKIASVYFRPLPKSQIHLIRELSHFLWHKGII